MHSNFFLLKRKIGQNHKGIHYKNYEIFLNLPEASLKVVFFPAHALYVHTHRHMKRQYTLTENREKIGAKAWPEAVLSSQPPIQSPPIVPRSHPLPCQVSKRPRRPEW